jgi:hypothetical protein
MLNSRSLVLALALALGCSDDVNLGSRACGQGGQVCCESANGIYCTQRDLVCSQPQVGGIATCAPANTNGLPCGSSDLPCCNINGVYACNPGTTCGDNHFCFATTDGSVPACGNLDGPCCYSANGIYCVFTGGTCRESVSGTSAASTCQSANSGLAACGSAQEPCCLIDGVQRCNVGLACNSSGVCM